MGELSIASVLDAMSVLGDKALGLDLFRDEVTVYGQDRSPGWTACLRVDEGEAVVYYRGFGETPKDAVAGLAKELEGRK